VRVFQFGSVRLLSAGLGCGDLLEQLFFAIHQGIDVVRGEFESMAVRDGVGRAGLHAIAAENTARVVDVVNAGVTFAGGNTIRIRIFRGFDVNAIRRTRRRAQEAANAFFQAAFVAMQDVNAADDYGITPLMVAANIGDVPTIQYLIDKGADLAAYERALRDAFDAADAPPLTASALAAVPQSDWPSLRFALHPSVRVIASDWPVDVVRAAVDQGESPADPEAIPTRVCVWRHEFAVLHRALSSGELAGLSAIARGASFEDVCSVIGEPYAADAAAREVAVALARWLADGWLVDPSTTQR